MTANVNVNHPAVILSDQVSEQIEKLHEKEATVKGRFRQLINFLFERGEEDDPYDLPPAMKARLYL